MRLTRGACLKEIITCRWACIWHLCLCWKSHTPPNTPLLYVHKASRELLLFSFRSPPQFPYIIEKIRGLWNGAQLSMLVSTVTEMDLVQLNLVIILHLCIDPFLPTSNADCNYWAEFAIHLCAGILVLSAISWKIGRVSSFHVKLWLCFHESYLYCSELRTGIAVEKNDPGTWLTVAQTSFLAWKVYHGLKV